MKEKKPIIAATDPNTDVGTIAEQNGYGFACNSNDVKAFVCCVHHSQLPVNYQEKDPRNYQGMPPCMLTSIIPAGKPSHVVAPLNVFDSGDGYYH